MALISPGVQVTVTDESFFIPAAASTVPLIFMATASEKLQPNGDPALGTYEYNVVRTITSLDQSVRTYGFPIFKEDSNSNPLHGDSRNEYGLFALNQFLGVGNKAYVVRANVNLNDDRNDVDDMWEAKMIQSTSPQGAAYILQSRVAEYITTYNAERGYLNPLDPRYKTSVSKTELIELIDDVLTEVLGKRVEGTTVYFEEGTFKYTRPTFFEDQSASPLLVYGNGFQAASTDTFLGVEGAADSWETSLSGATGWVQVNVSVPSSVTFIDNNGITPSQIVRNDAQNWVGVVAGDKVVVENAENPANNGVYTVLSLATTTVANDTINLVLTDVVEGSASSPGDVIDSTAEVTVYHNQAGFWTAVQARTFLVDLALDYEFTIEYINATTLGATDAQRRTAIVAALAAAINQNTDLRSEVFEYNLILCPGYPEVVDELLTLAQDINDEAFVIGETPMTLDPEEVVSWAATTGRRTSTNVAYYYPHGIASNLDGKEVYVAASGTALRTYTYSDNVSQLWIPPAGTQRGIVTSVSRVGYVKGTLGTPTTFFEVALNPGQRDNLYKYFTNVNPIVFFPNRGIIVWGQKTSASAASALDRVNVARLMGYIKRQLRKNTMPFVFQPNDQLTRDQLKAVVDSFLSDIVVKRGLYDFATICDASNNDAGRIDRNELYIDVIVKPTKAAEFIYIPIRVVGTGTDI